MDNETEKIFEDQLEKLPNTVIDFISSANWEGALDEIGSLYNLPEDKLSAFKREVTLVLAGLVHPDVLRETLEQEVGLQGSVLDAVVDATEQRIFASVRPALVEFFDQEANEPENEEIGVGSETREIQNVPSTQEIPRAPQRIWEKEPDIAPDNLPTDEEPGSFLPPIPQKPPKADAGVPSWDITPAHPFEEKMKKVFTAGQQSMGELAIEPPAQESLATQESKAPPIYHADPYREPIV